MAEKGKQTDRRTTKQKKGDWGEEKAAEYLKNKGYSLVCRKFKQ